MKNIHVYQKNNYIINRYNYLSETHIVLLIITILFQIHCHISRKQSRTQNTVVRGNYIGPGLKVPSWVVFWRLVAAMRVFEKSPYSHHMEFFCEISS